MKNVWNGLTPSVSTTEAVVSAIGEPEQTTPGATYGRVEHLLLYAYYRQGISIYLRGGNVFAILYVPKVDSPEGKLGGWAGMEGVESLPSSTAKNARVYADAAQGLAVHADHGIVLLVELFPKMDFATYVRDLYKKPPTFIK